MIRIPIACVLTCLLGISTARAQDRAWSLDSATEPGLSPRGVATAASGVDKTSLVFNGESLLSVADSSGFTADDAGFTLTAWVNPYRIGHGQQVIAAKNRYSLNERQWAVMIDEDGRFRLYVWQGEWVTADAETMIRAGHWHQVGVVVRPDAAELWVNGKPEGQTKLDRPITPTKAPVTFGGVDDNGRVRQNLFGALDEIRLIDRPLDAKQMAEAYRPVTAKHEVPEYQADTTTQPYQLWSGPPMPEDPADIPEPEGLTHSVIHSPGPEDYKFLHGAAIIHHDGVMYANWANSPLHENGAHETLRGKRSRDGGRTWSDLEIVVPGFDGPDCHSHGVYLEHKGELWTFCARFNGAQGHKFPGLTAEAFVLNKQTDKWESHGIVMDNCWPYDEPVLMDNGNYITGGQDKVGRPVIAISQGDDLGKKWDSVLIPYEKELQPNFAETTVWAEGEHVIAVIRGGAGVAWVSTSDDYGRTWTAARKSNLHMPRSKAYLGKLSTGQLYLVHNVRDRDTLVVSVSTPGESTLSKAWRIRHGKSKPVRFAGRAKSSQWSYPYAHEHDGKLYIVYSISKEDCGLSVIPIESLGGESK